MLFLQAHIHPEDLLMKTQNEPNIEGRNYISLENENKLYTNINNKILHPRDNEENLSLSI